MNIVEIIDLYIKENLTTYQLAEKFNTSRKNISKILKQNNIKINRNQRIFMNRKSHKLTQRQKEILFGTLLGDGCISSHGRKNKSYRFFVGHCEKQRELTNFINKELYPLSCPIYINKDKRGNSVMYGFSTLVHPEFEVFENLFYKNRIKIIPNNLYEFLTPLSMAIWFMDDGSLIKNVNMRISTESFTKEEHIIMKEVFKNKFNIEVSIRKYSREDAVYNYLSMNKKNSKIFRDLIEEFTLTDFYYKINMNL